MRALQHRGRLRAEEVRYAVDLIADHRGLRQQVRPLIRQAQGSVLVGSPSTTSQYGRSRYGSTPARPGCWSDSSPDSFDPDHQLRVGPAAHAVDELQQAQRRLQLLVTQVAESEPGSLTRR